MTPERLEYLATSFTHVRLLAGMNPFMNRQSGSLNELFVATRIVAHVRPYAGMDPFCIRPLSAFLSWPGQGDHVPWRPVPWRAKSLRRAKPLPQEAQGKAFCVGEPNDGRAVS